jgi:hypothetical protein
LDLSNSVIIFESEQIHYILEDLFKFPLSKQETKSKTKIFLAQAFGSLTTALDSGNTPTYKIEFELEIKTNLGTCKLSDTLAYCVNLLCELAYQSVKIDNMKRQISASSYYQCFMTALKGAGCEENYIKSFLTLVLEGKINEAHILAKNLNPSSITEQELQQHCLLNLCMMLGEQ